MKVEVYFDRHCGTAPDSAFETFIFQEIRTNATNGIKCKYRKDPLLFHEQFEVRKAISPER